MASMSIRGGKKNIVFNHDNDWNTPKYAFDDIQHLIPKDKIIWEAFYGDGQSGKYLQELGFTTEHHDIDFYDDPVFDYDIIVSNPPYDSKPKVFKRLAEINKPFMLLLPVSTITKQFLKKYFKDQIQIVIPSKRIHFVKAGIQSKTAWFDTCWLCYGLNLEKDITFL
tara:strand:- start:3703 stop:4203 length:501 start_codon:yes stop_codon:yes gene_type:complete